MGDSASTVRKAAEASAKAGQTEEAAGVVLLEEMRRRLIQKLRDDVRMETDSLKFELSKIITQRSAI